MEIPHVKTGMNTYVTFAINQTLMGIDILKAREIHPAVDITYVQHSPDNIRGLMNLRGRIITVVDLGIQLGMPSAQPAIQCHVVMLKHRDIGFMVDEIKDVITAEGRDIEPIPANMNKSMLPYMDHLVHLPDSTLIILSVDKILRKLND